MKRFSEILYPIDTKESVLKFIFYSDFREGPNPAKYIHKGYCKRANSSIRFDDFLRIIKQLTEEKMLESSIGANDQERFFLLLNDEQAAKIWKEKDLSSEKLNLEVEHLRYQMFDYDKTTRRVKRSEGYAILAIIVSLIAIVLPLICNKPG